MATEIVYPHCQKTELKRWRAVRLGLGAVEFGTVLLVAAVFAVAILNVMRALPSVSPRKHGSWAMLWFMAAIALPFYGGTALVLLGFILGTCVPISVRVRRYSVAASLSVIIALAGSGLLLWSFYLRVVLPFFSLTWLLGFALFGLYLRGIGRFFGRDGLGRSALRWTVFVCICLAAWLGSLLVETVVMAQSPPDDSARYARSLLVRTAAYSLWYWVGMAWLLRLLRASRKVILSAGA